MPKRCRAYFQYIGSKHKVMERITDAFPDDFNTYWEPFVGSGSVFFGNRHLIGRSRLSDLNEDIINTHRMVRDKPELIIDVLQEFKDKHSNKFYRLVAKDIRRHFSHIDEKLYRAARIIYLTKVCYGGTYRLNKLGQFNVSMSQQDKTGHILNRQAIMDASAALQAASVCAHTWNKVSPIAGDLIYLDPPYDHVGNRYYLQGFSKDAQVSLAHQCRIWRDKGVYILQSNSNTKLIRSLYKDFYITEYIVEIQAAGYSASRVDKTELLISSYRKD